MTTTVNPLTSGTRVDWGDLTDEQRAVASSKAATTLVLAGAGVGKTVTGLWAARRQLRTRPEQRVLFLTFSRSAVSQIRSRMGAVFGKDAGAIDVTTFHGLAWQMVVAHGQYFGLGRDKKEIRLDAEARLWPEADTMALGIGDLLPLALRVINTEPFKSLYRRRWSYVVCDEFQDTSDEQWALLEFLGEAASLLLMGDPNQMIYGWTNQGVGEHRIKIARERSGLVELPLGTESRRDHSQIIPNAAIAIRHGSFDDETIEKAIDAGRLHVVGPIDDSQGFEFVAQLAAERRASGAKSVGLYARANDTVTDLSAGLTARNMAHDVIGINEAQQLAMRAMSTLLRYGNGSASNVDVRHSLALFACGAWRARKNCPVPPIARQFAGFELLPVKLLDRLDQLCETTRTLEGADRITHTLNAWDFLAVNLGEAAWSNARHSSRLLLTGRAALDPDRFADRLDQEAEAQRYSYLVDLTEPRNPLQLMTFPQTKGREADETVLWFRTDQYQFEPKDEDMRLLYVALTRARYRCTLVLSEMPPLHVAPMLQYTQ